MGDNGAGRHSLLARGQVFSFPMRVEAVGPNAAAALLGLASGRVRVLSTRSRPAVRANRRRTPARTAFPDSAAGTRPIQAGPAERGAAGARGRRGRRGRQPGDANHAAAVADLRLTGRVHALHRSCDRRSRESALRVVPREGRSGRVPRRRRHSGVCRWCGLRRRGERRLPAIDGGCPPSAVAGARSGHRSPARRDHHAFCAHFEDAERQNPRTISFGRFCPASSSRWSCMRRSTTCRCPRSR